MVFQIGMVVAAESSAEDSSIEDWNATVDCSEISTAVFR